MPALKNLVVVSFCIISLAIGAPVAPGDIDEKAKWEDTPDHGVKAAAEEVYRLRDINSEDPRADLLEKYPGGPRGTIGKCWWIPGEPGKSIDDAGRIHWAGPMVLTDNYCHDRWANPKHDWEMDFVAESELGHMGERKEKKKSELEKQCGKQCTKDGKGGMVITGTRVPE